MVESKAEYAARLQAAMRSAGRDPDESADVNWLATLIGVSYQAVKKAIAGQTRMLAADNNVRAARALCVNSEWLATGEGSMVAGFQSPDAVPGIAKALPVVLDAIEACPAKDELRQLLPLLLTGAAVYRQRLADLLDPPPFKQSGQKFAG